MFSLLLLPFALAIPQQICLKQTYNRGVGKAPSVCVEGTVVKSDGTCWEPVFPNPNQVAKICPSGQERLRGLCYERCREGFTFRRCGPLCFQQCGIQTPC